MSLRTCDTAFMRRTRHFAGGRGSRKLETFHPSPAEPGGGHWTLAENFLGDAPQDDRTMHYAVVLPTRQVLVVNGGNFDFYGPVFHPLLLAPKLDAARRFTGYERTWMSEGVEPRHRPGPPRRDRRAAAGVAAGL